MVPLRIVEPAWSNCWIHVLTSYVRQYVVYAMYVDVLIKLGLFDLSLMHICLPVVCLYELGNIELIKKEKYFQMNLKCIVHGWKKCYVN